MGNVKVLTLNENGVSLENITEVSQDDVILVSGLRSNVPISTENTGSDGNSLTTNKGFKLGNNGDSAATAGAGSIRYTSGVLYLSNGTAWLPLGGQDEVVIVTGTNLDLTADDASKIFVMTNTGARTVSTPATPAANYSVTIKDGALTADTNSITIDTDGSEVFEGGAATFVMDSNGQSVRLAYSISDTTFYII